MVAPGAPSWHIRSETPGDAADVAAVVTAAFGQPAEAALVADLRAAGALALSLVALDGGGAVIGHIAFSPVTFDGGGNSGSLWGLAPLAVLPAWQGRGVGSALVEAGLAGARAAGAGLVVVLGDFAYYNRFGFRAAAERGLTCDYDVPPEAFMALATGLGATAIGSGRIRYHPAFARFAE